MKSVKRFDRGTLSKPDHRPNGWVRFDGYIARSGILEYARADGGVHREYRPPEENQAALDSFDTVPFTNNHPMEGLLTAENTRDYQVGTVVRAEMDSDKIRAAILCTDAATAKDIKDGKVELSCGYLCDVDDTPGEVDGQRYDAIQRNVRLNHVALVSSGRAGPEVRLRADSDAEILPADSQRIGVEEQPAMKKIRIDGVEYEASETVAQAFEKFAAGSVAQAKADADALAQAKADADKANARADAAEASAKQAREELAAAPEKIKAAMTARADLEAKASKVLGEGTDFNGKTDAEIRRLVVGARADGKSDAYVEAAFDLAVEQADGSGGEPTALFDAAPAGTADASRRAYEERLNSHFKK